MSLTGNKFCISSFIDDYSPTTSADHYVKWIGSRRLDVFDLGSDYISMDDHWLSYCEGFIVVYDICSRSSFNKAVEFLSLIQRTGRPSSASIVLVGNKVDKERKRQVSLKEGIDISQDWKCNFIEVSAKNYAQAESIFRNVVLGTPLIGANSIVSEPTKTPRSCWPIAILLSCFWRQSSA